MPRDTHYAVLNSTNTVLTFVICDADNEDSKQVGLEASNGVALIECPIEDQLKIGAHYHEGKFYHPSWVFDASQNAWVAPVSYPTDGCLYRWVENSEWQGWDRLTPYPSWIFSEEENVAFAPVSYPTDGKDYTWDEATVSWVEVSAPTE